MALCLSIRQPWAFSIVSLGKRVENRTWNCRYRGPIYIHAAKGMKKEEYEDWAFFAEFHYPGLAPPGTNPLDIPTAESLARGGIVGKCEIIDCIRSQYALPLGITREQADRHIVPWWQGPCGIIFAKVQPIPFVPCKGKLGLFELDDMPELEMA